MSMYVFGIVVAASDETPIGRASATLQVQLPALYPEHRFQFLGRKDLKSEEAELLFQVLVAEVRDVTDDEVVSEMASPDTLFRRFRMLSTESSPRRRLGTSTRELHGASLCLIVASFSMSHYRVSRAALSHVTGAGLRSRLGDRVAVDGGILRLARVPFSCALSVMS